MSRDCISTNQRSSSQLVIQQYRMSFTYIFCFRFVCIYVCVAVFFCVATDLYILALGPNRTYGSCLSGAKFASSHRRNSSSGMPFNTAECNGSRTSGPKRTLAVFAAGAAALRVTWSILPIDSVNIDRTDKHQTDALHFAM